MLCQFRWLALAGGALCCGCESGGTHWASKRNGNTIEIAYEAASGWPQYAALDLNSGYLRMVPRTTSDWGASVLILPSFWAGGQLHQGGQVTTTGRQEGENLLLHLQGTISGLGYDGYVTFSPPGDSFNASVSMTTSGSVVLDSRPGEAFKPFLLSSMHVSSQVWDTSSVQLGETALQLPQAGWIVQPPVVATRLALLGGHSQWKDAAPTIRIELPQPMPGTGWVTQTDDPNADNVGVWVASDAVLPTWTYTITAE